VSSACNWTRAVARAAFAPASASPLRSQWSRPRSRQTACA